MLLCSCIFTILRLYFEQILTSTPIIVNPTNICSLLLYIYIITFIQHMNFYKKKLKNMFYSKNKKEKKWI